MSTRWSRSSVFFSQLLVLISACLVIWEECLTFVCCELWNSLISVDHILGVHFIPKGLQKNIGCNLLKKKIKIYKLFKYNFLMLSTIYLEINSNKFTTFPSFQSIWKNILLSQMFSKICKEWPPKVDQVHAAAAVSSDHKISLRAALGCCCWKLQEHVASDIWKRTTKYNQPPWKWLAKVLKQSSSISPPPGLLQPIK